ncbi:hypothetical protein [Roseimicrobium sp. ORNL1]|uniref:hypothetical protein n=1 Tax=Roseimicrobium sp. ORNL1 TaxID=2711231 RepID=UPI0013E1C621|nr:hypothetical protein [Roseimicrobium sp. ORNL1]QIF03512.1 hypothetical protein G5S37_18940 [Roseimicrobium sp. ORNL1]
MRTFHILTLLFATLGIVTSSTAQEFKVGVAKADITPTEPIRLAGYASRNKPHESVEQPI